MNENRDGQEIRFNSGDRALAWLRRRAIWLPILAIFIFLVGCRVGRSTLPPEPTRASNYIAILPEFQEFYERNGGEKIFGRPLTEPYIEFDSGLLIQYFERMRLEYDADKGQVQIDQLGLWARPPEEDQVLAPMAAGQTLASNQENFQIVDDFLVFYEANDGNRLFGVPISHQLTEGDTRMQYFENARLEWHPDAPVDSRVQVGMLGQAHYRQVGIYENPGRSRPLDSAGIRTADVSTAFRAPILYAGDQQTIYVRVVTPEGQRPVASVSVEIAVTYNNGLTDLITMPLTNDLGYTQQTLALNDLDPGQTVKVFVTASAPDGPPIGTDTNSFRAWW